MNRTRIRNQRATTVCVRARWSNMCKSLHLNICPRPLTNHWLWYKVCFPLRCLRRKNTSLGDGWDLIMFTKEEWTVRHQRNVHFVLGWIFPLWFRWKYCVGLRFNTDCVIYLPRVYDLFLLLWVNNIIHMLQFAL